MQKNRSGISVIELVVAISIVIILLSLLLVGVMSVRETGRKISCANNARQISLAIQNYHSAFKQFPRGNGGGFSFHVRLLPYMGETARFNKVDFSRRALDQLNDDWTECPRVLACPSDPFTSASSGGSSTNYVGVSGGTPVPNNNGVIYGGSLKEGRVIAARDVTDGLSNTLAITETAAYLDLHDGSKNPNRTAWTFRTPRSFTMPDELKEFSEVCFKTPTPLTELSLGLGSEWIEASIGITRINCVFPKQPRNCSNRGSMRNALFAPSSLHVNGVYGGFADGSVRLLSQEISVEIWQALGTRNGGESSVDNGATAAL